MDIPEKGSAQIKNFVSSVKKKLRSYKKFNKCLGIEKKVSINSFKAQDLKKMTVPIYIIVLLLFRLKLTRIFLKMKTNNRKSREKMMVLKRTNTRIKLQKLPAKNTGKNTKKKAANCKKIKRKR